MSDAAVARTYRGLGDLYEEGRNLRRVGWEITTYPAPDSSVRTMTGPVLVEDKRVFVSARLIDVDGSADFGDLMGVGRLFNVEFDGGGHFDCTLGTSDGEVLPVGELVLPGERR